MTNNTENQDKNIQPGHDTSGSGVNASQGISEERGAMTKRRTLMKIWESCSGLHVIIYLIIVCAIIYFVTLHLNEVFANIPFLESDTILKIIFIVFFVILISCIVVFTKPLTDDNTNTMNSTVQKNGSSDNSESFDRLKRYWMILAYTFMIFSLVAAVFPFTVDFMPDPEDPDYYEHINSTIDKPIAVFLGCVLDKRGASNALHCYPDGEEKPPTLSWVMHIGGNLTAFAPTEKYTSKNLGDLRRKLGDTGATLIKKEIAQKNAQKNFDKINDELKRLKKLKKDDDKVTINLEKAQKDLDQTKIVVKNTRRELADLQPFLQGNAGYGVSGGLVVPIYLIVLSMFGAAISLTRRIPEYQKQAASGYVGTKEAPRLKSRLLREYLVFQIIQFISAPFLAAVAYFVIEPETTAAIVGLAFAAGFTSETVLIWVRGAVDKIKPVSVPDAHMGSIVGAISGMTDRPATELKEEYLISIVGRPELPVQFADGGQFVIEGVPVGDWALEVIKRNVAGVQLKTIYKRITVVADKPVTAHIDFK